MYNFDVNRRKYVVFVCCLLLFGAVVVDAYLRDVAGMIGRIFSVAFLFCFIYSIFTMLKLLSPLSLSLHHHHHRATTTLDVYTRFD